jgi:glutamyl-tRNA synthetase
MSDEASGGAVRTRFAPSPTGYLHVGTARTALFNYLFARRQGGTFVFRVEDTDVERNVEGGAESIAAALRWLGLGWDEGYQLGGPHAPYVQTERLDRYRTAVNALVAQGDAYPCYCTPEELAERGQAQRARGLPPGYDGHCRRLSGAELRAYRAEGRRPAVRFRLPDEGDTVVDDLIRGTVRFDNATLTDFVIMRASGIPTYMLSAVFDDVDMAVSHVIRGEDLFPATPRQLHIFRALGRLQPPRFAHLPLLVDERGKKLSKRFGEVAVQSYQASGFLPEAMVNYLALLGWGYDDHTEHFTLAELEQVFSIERVSRNPARFDARKLEALNGWYIRRLAPADLAERALPFVEAVVPDADVELLARAAPLYAERVNRLEEVAGMVAFLFAGDQIELDRDAAAKVLTEEGRAVLDAAAKRLAALDAWTADAVEATLRELQEERGLARKTAFQPIRLAITGKLVSPPLFESMALLGRDRSLARLEHARAAGGSPAPHSG